ncbi:NnrS family protein [Pontibacter sp. JAM-7]|uniref:NnrS family protein n=1 Tax=Pontibacter sp. JAM-7 TaxID=3366581 RepID=UPI003AF6BA98
MIPLQERQIPGRFALFYLGFRPFFLAGAVLACLLIPLWLAVYWQHLQPDYYPDGVTWHGHEMLFGFALAIIAGFLLTAVRNWTSQNTLQGLPLALLALLWLAARILPWLPGVPDILLAVIDLSFLPLLIISLAVPIWQARNYRNLMFLVLLSAFWFANLLVHLDIMGVTSHTRQSGLLLALFLVVLIMTLMGGRVIPFFTERAISGITCKRFTWLEKSLLPLTVLGLLLALSPLTKLAAVVTLVLGFMNSVRVAGWFNRQLLSQPLLWILHLGYGFIALGFVLYGLSLLDVVGSSSAIHAFAAGGIGCLTLGMMARVSLGHTGRSLASCRVITTAFSLMAIAALLRISLPSLPLTYTTGLSLTAILWSLGWLFFLIRYLPILIQPRQDGLFG